ncbi:MAG: alpha/beta fold hydrolase [Elainellaceae cyanobacterium]
MPQTPLPPAAYQLRSPEAAALVRQIEHRRVSVAFSPLRPVEVPTALVHQPAALKISNLDAPPLLLLPGFDSSLLEFRSLLPRLAPHSVWAMDPLGFGFTAQAAGWPVNRLTIRQHLYRSWQTLINRPVALVGASLGGAIAMDFALAHPECVARLILINSVGFSGHFLAGPLLFSPIDRLGVGWLRLRKRVMHQALSALPGYPVLPENSILPGYSVLPEVTAWREAALCAALHHERPGWEEAIISFTKSGGYSGIERSIAAIRQPTLVVWGERDDVLGIKDADRFRRTLPHSQLVWIAGGFHTPHLVNPQAVARAVEAFLGNTIPEPSP